MVLGNIAFNFFMRVWQIDLFLILIISIIASVILIKQHKKTGYFLLGSLIIITINSVFHLYFILKNSLTNEIFGTLNNIYSLVGIILLVSYVMAIRKLVKSDQKFHKWIGYLQIISVVILILSFMISFATLQY